MNEDARYYQDHKDDPDEWGEAVRPPQRPRRRLASMVSVRLTAAEHERIRLAAETAGESVSSFIRRAALERCSHPASAFTAAVFYESTLVGEAFGHAVLRARGSYAISRPLDVQGLIDRTSLAGSSPS